MSVNPIPETHDVVWRPADEEDHKYDYGHLECSVPGSVEEHEAGPTEAVIGAELVATEDLRDDTSVRDDDDKQRHAVHE